MKKTQKKKPEEGAVPPPPLQAPKQKKQDLDGLTRAQKLEILSTALLKQYSGQAVIRQGSDITNVFILRRPTGIMRLDLAMGGGFPAGGLSQIIGKDSSGKSYLVNRTIANVQKTYGDDAAIGICMTETPWDKTFAKWWCGVRVAFSDEEIARLNKIKADYGQPAYTPDQVKWLKDQVGYVQEVRAATAENLLEITCQMVESNLYQIVMVDSFGALLTAAEAEAPEGLSKKHYGGAAMTITQFMHRLHAALIMPDATGKPNTTTVLGINQYRDNVNAGMYGNPMKEAGGWALKHGKLIDLHLEAGKRHRVEERGPDQGKIFGKQINWEIIKGKAGCHDGPKGEYNFYFGERGYPFGVDTATDLLAAGLQYGIIEQSGAWYGFRGERIGQGAANAAQTISANPAWMEEIAKDVHARAGLEFITKEEF